MASLFRHPNSPYWSACFTLPDGRRTTRSTKEHDRRKAQRIANDFEDAAQAAKSGRLTELQARKVISDIFALSNGDKLASSTIRAYFKAWLQRKEIESNGRTHERYETVVNHMLAYLGGKAERDITHLSAKEIVEMRDDLSTKLSPNSANFVVKVLRAALNQARRDGLVDTNEASRVTLIQRIKKQERRPFTLPELQKVLAAANDEWRAMIIFGIYTGLRLGDIALLTWANVNIEQRELVLATQKTGRRQVISFAKPLLRCVEGLPAGDEPTAPLFPAANAMKIRHPNGGPLSNQFYAILVACGFAPKRTHKKQDAKKGRSGKRQHNELSFHCLRHTATSLLKNAGVSDVVARDIIGHDSEAVSRQYTHIDSETKRAALNKMPDLLG